MFINMTYLFFPLLLEHFLKKYFKEMACSKYSELSKELNKHFQQKKIIQPQEKEDYSKSWERFSEYLWEHWW